MTAVTSRDQAKVLTMVGTGSAKRDELLLGLARQLSWTPAQRDLVERMWSERQQQREGAMKKKAVLCVGLMAVLALVSGCATTYEKRFIDHEGKPVVIREHHDSSWWNNLGTPDWMNVRHETILRDGQIIADRDCEHDAGSPTVLDCR